MALELTTVALIQDYLGDTSISSATLTVFASAAELAIARACDREDPTGNGVHWGSATRTEYIDGNRMDYVLLKFTPITGVTTVDIVTGAATSMSIDTTRLSVDGIAVADLTATLRGRRGKLAYRNYAVGQPASFDYGEPVNASGRTTFDFGPGPQRVKAVYTGGYATVPADLSLAATMLAASMYRESTRDPSVRSQSLGDFSESFGGRAVSETPIPGSVEHLIGQYRRYSI